MITRRSLRGAASMAIVSGCTSIGSRSVSNSVKVSASFPPTPEPPAFYGPIPEEPFPIPAVPRGVVPQRYWRQRVANPFPEQSAGTIVVDPNAFYLHLVEEDGTAMRYGVGVGR